MKRRCVLVAAVEDTLRENASGVVAALTSESMHSTAESSLNKKQLADIHHLLPCEPLAVVSVAKSCSFSHQYDLLCYFCFVRIGMPRIHRDPKWQWHGILQL